MPGHGRVGIHLIAGRARCSALQSFDNWRLPGRPGLVPGTQDEPGLGREPVGPEAPKMSGPSVLIVDDDLDTRAKLRDILEKDDYRVAEAASISEALLERDWSEYLAILLDRRLPDQPVALVLPRLRQLAPDSAVIVVTAHDDIAGATEALRHGAIDYLLKPVDPVELRIRLRRIAEHRRVEKERREADWFARSVLDSLGANVAVLDDHGTIVAVNRAWRDFATANPAEGVNVAEGANYFEVCSRATGQDAEMARKFAAGIRDVLGGSQEYFELEYPCRRSRPATLVHRAGDPVPREWPGQSGGRAFGHHQAQARRRGTR